MNIKHNKKRNIGVVYELLIQHITSCIVEGDNKSAKVGTRLIEKHFSKEKELYKEFRLFNALANSTVSDTHIVASILSEAKRAARKIDYKKLEKEKSNLLRDINYKINKKDFFYQNILRLTFLIEFVIQLIKLFVYKMNNWNIFYFSQSKYYKNNGFN